MKNCADLIELISAYADGELTGSDKNRVEYHIAECESCSALLDIYQEITISVEESGVTPPEALSIGVMNVVRSESAHSVADKPKQKSRFQIMLTRYAPIAAGLAVMLLVWQFRDDMFGGRDTYAPAPAAPAPVADMAMPAPAAPAEAPVAELAPAPETRMESLEDMGAAGALDEADSWNIEPEMPQAEPIPIDSAELEEAMLSGEHRTARETELIAAYISNAYAEITVTGKLPAMLKDSEPRIVGSWFGWEMIFEIPSSEVPALLREIKNRDGVVVAYYERNSTYAVVMYSP